MFAILEGIDAGEPGKGVLVARLAWLGWVDMATVTSTSNVHVACTLKKKKLAWTAWHNFDP
jgi:hypothetical protein